MVENEWLKRGRIKKFKKNCTIALYTYEIDDMCTDWVKVYFPGRYSWSEDVLYIALDDTRPVYGIEIFHNGKIIYDQQFPSLIYKKTGELLKIDLTALYFTPPIP